MSTVPLFTQSMIFTNDPSETPLPEPRQTVLEDDFASGYHTRIPWNFINSPFTGGAWDNNTMSHAFTTLNGNDAVAITWKDGALPGDRWGGHIDLPGADIGPHAWFTLDLMFSDPFSTGTTSYGGKLPGLGSASPPTGCVSVNCGGGWSARHQWNGTQSSYSGSETLPGHQYLYYPNKPSSCGVRENFDNWPNTGFSLNTAHTLVQEVKINSAFNQNDGYVRTFLDDVLIKDTTVQFYCNSESNRSGALVAQLLFMPFYGGSGSAWSPTHDSTITFGAFKVEIPNP